MEDEDDFLASIGASVEDEDAALAEMGVSVEADGDLPGTAELPGDMRETGQRSRVTQLPAFRMAAGGGMVQDEGPAEVYEERTVEKAPSAHDVAPGTVVGTDRRTPHERTIEALAPSDGGVVAALTGRQGMTPASIRQAAQVLRRGGGLGDAASVAMPTAPRPEGMSASEPDRRPSAAWRGIGGAALFGQADELGAALGGVRRPWLGEEEPTMYAGPQSAPSYTQRRDALRQEAAESAEQAPWGEAAGQLIGSAPLALLPGGQSTALGRVGTAMGYGAATGALRGAGESEAETPAGVLLDAGTGAAIEGTAGALVGGAGEGVRAVGGRIARSLTDGGLDALQDRSTHAALEARGIWGRRAMEQARDRPGGAEALVRELAEAGAPLDARRMPDFIDQMLDTEGERVGRFRDAVDVPVDYSGIADDLEGLARTQTSAAAPLSGSDATMRALQERAARAREAGQMSMGAAHGERRVLDAQANWGNPDAAMSSLAGQRQAIRRALSRRMAQAAEAAGVGDEWTRANRGYALAAELDDIARGGERLNMQGGMAGAFSRAHGVSQMLAPSSTLGQRGAGLIEAIGGAHAGQELRLRTPGMTHSLLERLIPALRSIGETRFGSVIEHARRTRGPAGAAAAHYLMMRTRPEYREAVERAEQAQEQAR